MERSTRTLLLFVELFIKNFKGPFYVIKLVKL